MWWGGGGAWSAEGPSGPVTRAVTVRWLLGQHCTGAAVGIHDQGDPSLVEKGPWFLMAHSTSLRSPMGTMGTLRSSATHPLALGLKSARCIPNPWLNHILPPSASSSMYCYSDRLAASPGYSWGSRTQLPPLSIIRVPFCFLFGEDILKVKSLFSILWMYLL